MPDLFKNYSLKNVLNTVTDPFKKVLKTPMTPAVPNIGSTPLSTPYTPPVTPQNTAIKTQNAQTPVATQPKVASIPPIPTINSNFSGVTSNGSYSTGTPTVTPPNSSNSAPNSNENKNNAPVTTPEQKTVDSLTKAYTDALKISPEEMSTQEDLDKLIESAKTSFRNASNQAIPLEFITGQQKAIEERALGLAEPMEKKLARLQAQRTASSEASKFALERADKKMAEAKGTTVGNSIVKFNPVTGKYDTVYSSPKDTGFTLSPGEKRYDDKGDVIASGGEKPMSATQEAKMIEQQDKEKSSQQSATQSIGLINTMLEGGAYKTISGIAQTGVIPFTSGSKTSNQYNQLKSMLALGARGLLKGSGAVSDYESKVLNQSTSNLGRNLGEADFEKALKTVRGVLKTNSGQETEIRVTNPKTGETVTTTGSGKEIYDLVSEGNVVEYL